MFCMSRPDCDPPPLVRSLVLDVRGMPAPEPVARILDVVDDFLPGDRLQLMSDTRPLPLLRLLECFGYGYREQQGTESRYEFTIWREAPGAQRTH